MKLDKLFPYNFSILYYRVLVMGSFVGTIDAESTTTDKTQKLFLVSSLFTAKKLRAKSVEEKYERKKRG